MYRFDCGSGSAELKSQQAIVLEREVDVTIKLMGNMGYLSVDYEHEISGKSKVRLRCGYLLKDNFTTIVQIKDEIFRPISRGKTVCTALKQKRGP